MYLSLFQWYFYKFNRVFQVELNGPYPSFIAQTTRELQFGLRLKLTEPEIDRATIVALGLKGLIQVRHSITRVRNLLWTLVIIIEVILATFDAAW